MNLLKVMVILCIALLNGCMQHIYLKKAPSEFVLISLKSEEIKCSYSFKSKIEDTLCIGNFCYDVNDTYRSNLKIYMNTKFQVQENENIVVDFVLTSCNQTRRNANSGVQNTTNVLVALGGGTTSDIYNNVLLTTEININVIVKKDQRIVALREISTTDEYNGDGSNIKTSQDSFDQAIGKSIILIDKFLSSLNEKLTEG